MSLLVILGFWVARWICPWSYPIAVQLLQHTAW